MTIEEIRVGGVYDIHHTIEDAIKGRHFKAKVTHVGEHDYTVEVVKTLGSMRKGNIHGLTKSFLHMFENKIIWD